MVSASSSPCATNAAQRGKPAFYDEKYSGTYNARGNNPEGFWKGQFGHTHGIMVVNAFYENVNLHRSEGRELREGEEVRNAVLEFKPRPTQNMLVACLWCRWIGPGEPDLLSFAATRAVHARDGGHALQRCRQRPGPAAQSHRTQGQSDRRCGDAQAGAFDLRRAQDANALSSRLG